MFLHHWTLAANANATGNALPVTPWANCLKNVAAKDAERKAIAPRADGTAPRPLDERKTYNAVVPRGCVLRGKPRGAAAPAATLNDQLAVQKFLSRCTIAARDQWLSNLGRGGIAGTGRIGQQPPSGTGGYDAAASSAREERQRILRAIGGAVIAGSISLLVLLAVLGARRKAGKLPVIVPALAVSLASLLVGVAWVGWLPRGGWQEQRIAMTGAAPAAIEPAADSAASALPSAAAGPTSDFASACLRFLFPIEPAHLPLPARPAARH
jgi:hypothetical protein